MTIISRWNVNTHGQRLDEIYDNETEVEGSHSIKKTPWPLFSHFSSPFLETLEQKNNIRIGDYPCINACLPNFRRSKSFFFLFFLVQKNVTILCSFMILQYFCKWFSVYYLNFSYLQVVGITYYQLICVSKFE